MSIPFKIALCVLSLCVLTACNKNAADEVSRAVATTPAHATVALSAQTKTCLKEYGVSYEQLAAQFALFQAALQKDSPSEASALISYPLRVNLIKNGQHVSKVIKNTAQFTMRWPQLFSDGVKQKILAAHAEDSNQMICNDLGIGFADGLVWFYGDSSAQIYVVNNIG